MIVDEQRHVALPKLYGAPAYARPVVAHVPVERPFDPDDLPLEHAMTDEDIAALDTALTARHAAESVDPEPNLTPRPFSLHAISNRLRIGRR